MISTAVLATIAIFSYQDYVSRAQLSAALADISTGKTQLEAQPLTIGPPHSQRCQGAIRATLSGLAMAITGNAMDSGQVPQWVRDPASNPAGALHCKTDLPLSPLPAACIHMATAALMPLPL
jgi:type IV pilus assembly protein PilA